MTSVGVTIIINSGDLVQAFDTPIRYVGKTITGETIAFRTLKMLVKRADQKCKSYQMRKL
ncbi:hypothetical protein H5410_030419 [Solanum commersonii]|uniref:Uncharacterized protein n=1 Tax=Solanum commersonii TaxID=4109 RepID=A0A9J5YFM3_SOLCO|nr:hypothetical protein H5410_030419 [Solanum commersonii]